MKNKRGGRGGRGGRGDRGGTNAQSNQRFDFPSHGSGYWYGRFGDFYKDTDVQSESEFSYAHSEVGSEFSYQPPSEAAPGRAYEY
jgi:hypothetical protein